MQHKVLLLETLEGATFLSMLAGRFLMGPFVVLGLFGLAFAGTLQVTCPSTCPSTIESAQQLLLTWTSSTEYPVISHFKLSVRTDMQETNRNYTWDSPVVGGVSRKTIDVGLEANANSTSWITTRVTWYEVNHDNLLGGGGIAAGPQFTARQMTRDKVVINGAGNAFLFWLFPLIWIL